MKLWELIIELEKLEQEGKRDYDVWVDYMPLNKISTDNEYKEVNLN